MANSCPSVTAHAAAANHRASASLQLRFKDAPGPPIPPIPLPGVATLTRTAIRFDLLVRFNFTPPAQKTCDACFDNSKVVKNLRQFTLGSSGDRGGSLGAPARGFGQRKFMSEGYFGANDESDEDADGHNVSFDNLKPSFKSVSKFQTAAVRRPTTNTCCRERRRITDESSSAALAWFWFFPVG